MINGLFAFQEPYPDAAGNAAVIPKQPVVREVVRGACFHAALEVFRQIRGNALG